MRLKKLLLIATVIFSAGYTGCGDDGGGGGGGNSAKRGSPKVPQVQRLATRSLGQISSGENHTCALTAKGETLCWGKGDNGQLGNNANSDLNYPHSSKPVVDENGDPLIGIVQVSAGVEHTCALTAEGEVLCWGKGDNGRLGNDCISSCTDKSHAVAVVAEDDSTDPLAGIVQISAGKSHTCALSDTSEVFCWGQGEHGKLGNNATTDQDHPVGVVSSGDSNAPLLTGIVQVSAGDGHTCALTSEGEIKCWGFGTAGQLGNDANTSRSYPVNVIASTGSTAPLTGIVQVSTGRNHTCAVTSAGGVKCWGYGQLGKLGNGSSESANYPVNVVASNVPNDLLSDVVHVSAGQNHSCALTSSGGVKCWGYNSDGQLGIDAVQSSYYPVDVIADSDSPFALSGIVQMSGGLAHTCALTTEGEIKCWGHGSNGKLGNNTTDTQFVPVHVVLASSGKFFHAGVWRREYHCYSDDTCEIDPDSLIRPILTGARVGISATPDVKVLGLEEDESVTLHTDPKCISDSIGTGTVATGADSVTITPTTSLFAKKNRIYAKVGETCSTSGADYTYAIFSAQWISGDALSTDRTPTFTVFGGSGDKLSLHASPDCSDDALASGTAETTTHVLTLSSLAPGSHTFYLKQNEICHPRGFDYQLAEYIREYNRIAGGSSFSCAVTSGGGVKCWGEGDDGRLGNNATSDTDYPDDVEDSGGTAISNIFQVSTNGTHACAVTFGGGVVCWGEGANGRLGNDCNASCSDSDHAVDVVDEDDGSGTLIGIVQVSSGNASTCALTAKGGVVCWGKGGVGQLGDKGTADKDHPVAVVNSNNTPLTGIVQIASGQSHTCALTTGGKVKCWGSNTYGELGNGNNNSPKNHAADVLASGTTPLGGIVQISSRGYHTCALTTGGKVKCWGSGSDGQLGNKGTSNSYYPVDVVTSNSSTNPLSGIVQVNAGGAHTCALTSINRVVCWGDGDNGQLGNKASSDTGYPVSAFSSGANVLTGIAQIGLGYYHSCGITTLGQMRCWGDGDNGQLGNDGSVDKNHAVTVIDGDGSSTALNIGTTGSRYVCGDVRCVPGI